MESKSVPDELLALRDRIDEIDDDIVSMLARRFAATREVGLLKARNSLGPVDAERERQKLERLGRLAEQHGLNRDFVMALFRDIFREVVKNHQSLAGAGK